VSAQRVVPATDPADLHVRLGPMKRRHLRQVMRIEQQVYPRPWSLGVFYSELGHRDGSRCYVVARVGTVVVGYAGLLLADGDGHVTNVAVDPEWHRHKIGTRLMLTLAQQARAGAARSMTLEVRVSNHGAQALYTSFGFSPVGVRKRYYENVEDAIVMWAHDIDGAEFAARLREIEGAVPGQTSTEGLA
jgi:[ribosomal protein S18]-alanine N-acetyltransferase